MKLKELECIKRMVVKGHYYDFINWFLDSDFITEEEIKPLVRDLEKSEFIYEKLKSLEKQKKLILLYFEWQYLPLERIKITCTTHTEEKHFTYGL